MSRVLVTGGSGFVASYAIIELLRQGHDVRTTVRNPERENTVRAMIRAGGVDPGDRLAFIVADLQDDGPWSTAVAGCDYVLHIASPFPASSPKNEDELIVPAREGTLRILRAARDARVKRVVLTSSFAAIGYGHKARKTPFTEADWTDPARNVSPYVKSKTLSERAAWEFIAREGGALELSVINPAGVMGPVLGPDYSASVLLVKRLIDGAMTTIPRLYFGLVDVRDVADLHVRAMSDPAAKGERFLAVAGDFMSMFDIVRVLRDHLGPAGAKLPRLQLPDWFVRIAALRDPAARAILPELGKMKNASSEKAERVLRWSPRSREEAIIAAADSLMRLSA